MPRFTSRNAHAERLTFISKNVSFYQGTHTYPKMYKNASFYLKERNFCTGFPQGTHCTASKNLKMRCFTSRNLTWVGYAFSKKFSGFRTDHLPPFIFIKNASFYLKERRFCTVFPQGTQILHRFPSFECYTVFHRFTLRNAIFVWRKREAKSLPYSSFFGPS